MEFIHRHIDRIESTHTYLMQNGRRLPHGTVITADFQEQGRGRLEREWIAPPGSSLLLSVLLKPKINITDSPLFTHIMSLACLRALSSFGIDTKIRWPNDLTCKGKKIAGLLSESDIDGQKLLFIVASVGINLNQDISQIAQIDRPATSCLIETGRKFDANEVLNVLLKNLNEIYTIFSKEGFGAIKPEWESKNSLKSLQVELDLGNKRVQGKVIGFSNTGEIILQDTEGIKYFGCGEVIRVTGEIYDN